MFIDYDKDKEIQMMNGAKFPLSSFSVTSLIGAVGSGKTTFAFKMQEEYLRLSKEKYDWSNQFDVKYKKFTEILYISPTKRSLEKEY